MRPVVFTWSTRHSARAGHIAETMQTFSLWDNAGRWTFRRLDASSSPDLRGQAEAIGQKNIQFNSWKLLRGDLVSYNTKHKKCD